MVSFIVCEDNQIINKNIVNRIDMVMMKNKIPYKKHVFEDYNKSFMKLIDTKLPNKIYILDIETPSASGIDIVRKIRENDLNSIIIFLTAHDELGYTILKQEFMFLAFICKFDDYLGKLEKAIKKALKVVGQKRVLSFSDHGIIYNLPFDDITYITRDSVDRKCIIKTDYSEFKVSKSLTELFEQLNDNFKFSHRACIVNMERIRVIDKRNRVITFDNKETIDLMNDDFKKEAVGIK